MSAARSSHQPSGCPGLSRASNRAGHKVDFRKAGYSASDWRDKPGNDAFDHCWVSPRAVMPGLVPGINRPATRLTSERLATEHWIAGTSPATTNSYGRISARGRPRSDSTSQSFESSSRATSVSSSSRAECRSGGCMRSKYTGAALGGGAAVLGYRGSLQIGNQIALDNRRAEMVYLSQVLLCRRVAAS